MSRLSINELTTFRWTFEDDIYRYADAGVRSIGIWRPKLADYGEEKGAELLREANFRVTSLSWAGGFTSTEMLTFDDQVQDARETIDLAAELGAPCVTLLSGPRGSYTHNHARRLFRKALEQLFPRAEKLGVLLALEPMHESCARDWTFLNNLSEVVALLDEFDQSPLRLAIDSYHFSRDPLFYEHLDRLAGKLQIVYLSDSRAQPNAEQDRCRLGEGAVPLREFIEQVESRGFSGSYEVRLMGEAIEREGCYKKLLDESQHFVRSLLQSACGPA